MSNKQKAVGTSRAGARHVRRAVKRQAKLPRDDFSRADFARMEQAARAALSRSARRINT